MFTLLHHLLKRKADKAALPGVRRRKPGSMAGRSPGKRSMSRVSDRMFRDMALLSGVKLHLSDGKLHVLRDPTPKSGGMRQRSCDTSRMSGSMDQETRDMARRSGNMQQESGDRLPKSPDLMRMPDDLEGMSQHFADLGGRWAAPVALLRTLRGLVRKQRDRISAWYWRLWGMEDPEYRRLLREADFDELFELELTYDTWYQELPGLFGDPWSGSWGPWIHYLEAERSLKRRARRSLAPLLAYVLLLLRRPERKRRWSFALRSALRVLDLCGPLNPRPPPCAFA